MSKYKNDKLNAEDREKARHRFHLMAMVEAGHMTATEAADALGISRVTFYEWQNAALTATLEALTDGDPGRPKIPETVLRIRELELALEQTKKALSKSEVISELKSTVIAIRDSQLAERKKKTER